MKKLTRELILYSIFGVLTTLINILAYSALYYRMDVANTPANVISWVVAVIFAYVTNRIWVFKSRKKKFLPELIGFFGCRALTGILDVVLMYTAVDILLLEGGLMKILSNIIVIVLNYVFSKTIIFKKGR